MNQYYFQHLKTFWTELFFIEKWFYLNAIKDFLILPKVKLV